MNLRRVAPGDWAVGVCGALLIGSLWLPWYRGAGHDYNAWQSMAVNDVILFGAGALAIGLVLVTAAQPSGAIPITLSVFTSLGGILAAVLAVIRLIWPPDLGVPADRLAGVWIGTAAAAALAVTALLSMRNEHRGVEGLAQVEITSLPAPRGNGA